MKLLFVLLYVISFINISYSHESIGCQELWDTTSKSNGVQIYKMKLYACINGYTPNLRGTIPKLLENPVKLLNYSVHNNSNLSKSIKNNNQTNITNSNMTYIHTTTFNPITILSSTTTLSPTTTTLSPTTTTLSPTTTTLSPTTTTLSLTTSLPSTLSPTTSLPETKSPDVIVEPYQDRKVNYTQNSSTQFYNVEKGIVNTVQDTTLQIVVITASSMCCCFSIVSYFVWKAHRKQIKN